MEIEIPENEKQKADEARHHLIEKLAEVDDEVLLNYLDGKEITPEEIRTALRRVTLAAKGVPVFCGSALRYKGIHLLLDAIVNYLPSPLDMPAVKAVDIRGADVHREASDDEPFMALAFKVVSDPFVGRLVYFRVYSGTIEAGAQVFNSTRRRENGSAACCSCMPTAARK